MLDYRYYTFLSLANHLNYTKAAKALALSQPAVTKHIQFLEEQLETKLFLYQDRQLHLTKKGYLLKQRLMVIERDINELLAELTDSTEKPSFTVGVSRTIGEYYIPNHTCLFCEEQALTLHLLVENTEQLLNFLHQERVDYALISGPVNDKAIATKPFFEDEIVLACSPLHKLSGQVIDFTALYDEHLILREEGSGVGDAIQRFTEASGYSLDHVKRISRIGNIQLLKNYIKNNDGLGFIYRISIERELNEGSLSTISIRDFNMKQPFYLAYLAQSKNKKEVNQVINAFMPNKKP